MRLDNYDGTFGGIDNDGDNKVDYANKSDCRIDPAPHNITESNF